MNRNDTNYTQINITEDGIAWPEDLQLYKQPQGYKSFQWTNITNGINFGVKYGLKNSIYRAFYGLDEACSTVTISKAMGYYKKWFK